MADTVATQTLRDDDRYLVMKFTCISDGTGESAVTKIDVSSLSTRSLDGAACTGVVIDKLYYDISGLKVQILWDATADVVCFIVTESTAGHLDFSCFGGLTNNAGAGKTGDVKFTTTAADAGDTYSIIMFMRKEY